MSLWRTASVTRHVSLAHCPLLLMDELARGNEQKQQRKKAKRKPYRGGTKARERTDRSDGTFSSGRVLCSHASPMECCCHAPFRRDVCRLLRTPLLRAEPWLSQPRSDWGRGSRFVAMDEIRCFRWSVLSVLYPAFPPPTSAFSGLQSLRSCRWSAASFHRACHALSQKLSHKLMSMAERKKRATRELSRAFP